MTITSMFDEMNKTHQQLIDENRADLANMLDFAICELVSIAEDNEIYLIDDMHICKEYEDIFNCLKHWSRKREEKKA